ncbi:MAG: [FeFe] hydrogenase H-cluster radical SAM maturase HydG [bacterium]|nr:[FeFe] hydrogenase H-cluster radical SAM maturase HydG [bacterium]
MIINETEINGILEGNTNGSLEKKPSAAVRDILAKSLDLEGLSPEEVAILCNIEDPEFLNELFTTARTVKEKIYGKRMVIFAPLYISNFCDNECLYCAFRAGNKALNRKILSLDEIGTDVEYLLKEGYKRLLLVAGESYPPEGFEFILKAIDRIYAAGTGSDNIRRINVNVAPLTTEEFRLLKEAHIGTYQLFQETYHHETYAKVHTGGRKRDYNWRITGIDRAMEAGIDDCGIGVLFGLYNWRFEILALMQHIRHLEKSFGLGPHTLSVPRLEPASGSPLSERPPALVSDGDFKKIVAILRLAVPYTGIIMSTRETPAVRRETFALGVSQVSAGSRTSPGGYGEASGDSNSGFENSQFSLGDHRSLDEVIRDMTELGYLPSFCTACYRRGRTGLDFMRMAKPGEIKHFCDPNALASFLEYCIDYGSPETRAAGEEAVKQLLTEMDEKDRVRAEGMIEKVRAGKRDVNC